MKYAKSFEDEKIVLLYLKYCEKNSVQADLCAPNTRWHVMPTYTHGTMDITN